MTTFRLAASQRNKPHPNARAPLPKWLTDQSQAHKHSFQYWTKLYWATPPWLTDDMIQEMRVIYEDCVPGEHVDHIVPLKGTIVCGLHVPWNLQKMKARPNLLKSNHWWPDHPFENLDLFQPPQDATRGRSDRSHVQSSLIREANVSAADNFARKG